MNKLFNLRMLSFVCFVAFIGIATSCKKNDAKSGNVELLSFGPTGAKHGDTLLFIGKNLTKVTAIQFTGDAAKIDQKSFVSQSEEVIKLKVPTSAEKGFVTLKTPEGDIVSKTIFNLNVLTSVTTITAQARPGENITITGNYLNWVTRITFARDKLVTNFVSKSINQIVVTVPADAETGPLILSYGGTDSAEVQTADTLKVTLPVTTGFGPNPIKHQTNLTITGTNLDLAKKIIFAGVTTPVTTFVSQSATQIVVKVPAGTQTGKVTLVAASGVTSVSTMDLQVVLPAITNIGPNPILPLDNLTITGTNLDLVTGVSFTGIVNPVTTFVSQSATQLVVKVPDGTLKGKITLSVLNSSLTVVSSQVLDLIGGLPPLADFPYPIYTDALQNGYQNWSWAANDFNSTAIVRQGTTSIKATYGAGGYEGITFHAGAPTATAGYTKFEFSVFGEAGTGGKTLNVVVNGNWGSPATVTVLAGEWSTFSINLSAIGATTTLSEVVLQSAGWSGVIHIDHVGLR
ncbi:IPT/TIG domain-containing protein [Lacibacter sp. H375]|uniref:IPT/TIG domain-containing protein n=1 Tax=Lacibacter sp. H375 TaxID=3133424 RepID=UPI0030C33642